MAKILIINQSTTVARRLEAILERMGHKIIGTPNTTLDSLELVSTAAADIIFIDLAFGEGHDGAQFVQIVLQENQSKIIFMVTSANKATAQRARAIQPDGYLVYPFTEQSVYESLVTALNPEQQAELPAVLQSILSTPEVQPWHQIPEEALLKVRTYVRENLEKEVTLKRMATIVGMSESNFSRRFKTSMGITPYQYVLQERLEEAKHMLRHQELSLVDIAAATGFCSQSHFTTVFKKSTKLTPLQYRRQ
jgi:AraC-like DNA-binding protein